MTKGRMFMGVVLPEERFPGAELRAFALVRTLGQSDVEKVVDPCVGVIPKMGDHANRFDAVPPEDDDLQKVLF